jgi:hypothetical protein
VLGMMGMKHRVLEERGAARVGSWELELSFDRRSLAI